MQQPKAAITADEWVVVGRFGRPHGIKGWVTIVSFTDPRDNIVQFESLYGFIRGQWQQLPIQQVDIHHKHILVQVKGYAHREDVAGLTNVEIAVKSKELPTLKPGEYYWHDLMGMQVINQAHEVLGSITDIMATGANDVLVIEGKKRHLIPYLLDDVIITIDKSHNQIIVNWDEDF